ncbi:MAG: ferrous iron transporter B, partial [Myxococcota bacterium]
MSVASTDAARLTPLPDTKTAREPYRCALIGPPNAGKTTLFNAFTGARAKVANFPGVTVQRREGWLKVDGREVKLVDLPGAYSLEPESEAEAVIQEVLSGTSGVEARPDALLLVLDATNLPRGLGLVPEAMHLGLPMILVLTMIDEVQARGMRLDVMKLSERLGIPVVGVVGTQGVGVAQLKRALASPERWWKPDRLPPVDDPVARYAWVDEIVAAVTSPRADLDPRTERIDRVLLHPVGGLAVFAAVMVLLFQSVFGLALPFMDGIQAALTWLSAASTSLLPAGLLRDFWVDGVIAGVGAVLVFVPQIAILFALIHFLEDVGYMSRAAFVVDRVMGWVGLQGRSFVPLLSSCACAVPGILSARTIPSHRDRLATILVAPLMTCSARLPVYALIIAAFIPARAVWGFIGLQGLVMLGLYLLGALAALGSAALLSSTLLRGTPARFYMELPPYRLPAPRLLGIQIWGSVRSFLKRAGTIILGLSLVFWVLLSFPRADVPPEMGAREGAQLQIEHSIAGSIGQA